VETDPASAPTDRPAEPGAPADDPGRGRSARVEAVRRVVDQALAVTYEAPRTTRARAQDLADELGSVVTRVRGALEDLSAAGTTQAGVLADEVQQAVGRLGRSLDDARPVTGDELRRLGERLASIEERLDRLESAGASQEPGSSV
jgi:hypothetical protein